MATLTTNRGEFTIHLDDAELADRVERGGPFIVCLQHWPDGLDESGETLAELELRIDSREQIDQLIEGLRRVVNEHHLRLFQARAAGR